MWIRSIYTYFNTFPDLTDERKNHISSQLEGLAQTWWDTQQENTTFMVDIGDSPGSSTSQLSRSWAQICEALKNHFYPP